MAQASENMAGGPKTDLIFIPTDQYFPLSLFTAGNKKVSFKSYKMQRCSC